MSDHELRERELHGQAVLDVLQGNDSLLDSRLVSLTIAAGRAGATVHMHFECRPSSQFLEVDLAFEGVEEFGFYSTRSHSIAYVTSYKLFRTPEGLYYISLDPVDERDLCSEEDQDLVLARQLVARCRLP